MVPLKFSDDFVSGGPLQMSLCGCDGGKKDDGTPPESVLTNSWAGTQGKRAVCVLTQISMILFLRFRLTISQDFEMHFF